MNCLTSLYKYQVSAVEKLMAPRVGALFMDMGTGKTRCAIELIARRQARIDHVVWFCPVMLKATIREELLKHTDLAPEDIYVFDAHTQQRALPQAFVYVVGLESVGQSDRVTLAVDRLLTERSYVVVDESSYIKGHTAKRTARLTALAARCRYRLLLTGTPLSQGVVDLFAQMRFLSPAILGYQSYYSFAANHLEYSDRYPDKIVRAHNVAHLAAKMQPYVYQVSKDECLDLPDKLYDALWCSLTEAQMEAYAAAKDEFLPLLQDVRPWQEPYVLFQLFTALQEIVSGFRQTADGLREYPHYRLALLLDRLAALPEDAKVIVWARYRYSIAQIIAALTTTYGAAAVAELHGGIPERSRGPELARWRAAGGARFLVATQATGGHGLTLTEADQTVFYENGFKYAERVQAEDRIHRIGQTRPCTYTDLVSTANIDRRIQRALAAKADVVAAFRAEVQQVRDRKERQALASLVLEL